MSVVVLRAMVRVVVVRLVRVRVVVVCVCVCAGGGCVVREGVGQLDLAPGHYDIVLTAYDSGRRHRGRHGSAGWHLSGTR